MTGMYAKLYAVAQATRTPIAEGTEVSISVEADEIETTSFDSNGWKEAEPGIRSWSLDHDAFYVDGDAGQDDLYDALVTGAKIEVEFFPKNATGVKGWAGRAIVTSWEMGTPVDDAITISVSLSGDGKLNRVTKTESGSTPVV
ncbi:phage tail tube protein [Paenibacillus sp. J31TS4]|uniref:phage tail tube protein n=1 Tax=Paenibacillus sp. J31TS4 TaxID=2807195 RepID=UPI0020C01E4E|nr:phage major tail protein, TP901-1 family [Paenibacillus sp. J31TS4]